MFGTRNPRNQQRNQRNTPYDNSKAVWGYVMRSDKKQSDDAQLDTLRERITRGIIEDEVDDPVRVITDRNTKVLKYQYKTDSEVEKLSTFIEQYAREFKVLNYTAATQAQDQLVMTFQIPESLLNVLSLSDILYDIARGADSTNDFEMNKLLPTAINEDNSQTTVVTITEPTATKIKRQMRGRYLQYKGQRITVFCAAKIINKAEEVGELVISRRAGMRLDTAYKLPSARVLDTSYKRPSARELNTAYKLPSAKELDTANNLPSARVLMSEESFDRELNALNSSISSIGSGPSKNKDDQSTELDESMID